MNLSEMLSFADISQLSSIAKQYGCECSSHSKHELIQSILSNVQRKEVITHSLERLDLEELRFLNYLLFEHIQAFSLEDLLARVQQCRFDMEGKKQPAEHLQLSPVTSVHSGSGVQPVKRKTKKSVVEQVKQPTPREMIVRFKSQGWLFNGHRAQDRYLFHVPTDFRTRYRQILLSKWRKEVVYCEAPMQIEDESGKLLEDMSRMLDYITKHQPSAAADGVLHRRAVQQLNELCCIQTEMPSKGAWKFGYGKGFGELPDRLTLMYDYMWCKKWIVLLQDRIMINEANKASEHILQRSELNDMVLHWMKGYRTPVPNIRALVYWVVTLTDSWCSLQSLERLLLPYIKPYYFDSAVDVFHKRIIKPLKHFGVLQVGHQEHEGYVLQASNYGRRLLTELYTER
jgi:hypothetical protein